MYETVLLCCRRAWNPPTAPSHMISPGLSARISLSPILFCSTVIAPLPGRRRTCCRARQFGTVHTGRAEAPRYPIGSLSRPIDGRSEDAPREEPMVARLPIVAAASVLAL